MRAPDSTEASVASPVEKEKRAPVTGETATLVRPSRAQQFIARRMVQAHSEIPSFNVTAKIEMRGVNELRLRLKQTAQSPVPSVTDIIVGAVARTLRAFPMFNSSYVEEQFVLHERVNVGIAVALSDLLVVPTVFDADRMGLDEIALVTTQLVQGARARTLKPAQLGGGTFTISNLGMLGVESFTPIVNPPQAAILGVGKTSDNLSVEDGVLVQRPTALFSLSCDHRLVYGADAARFLQHLAETLQEPEHLLKASPEDVGGKND